MLDAFYGAFSPACLALLGLWLVAVQMRAEAVRASRELTRRAYAVALFFALPGLMSVIALIDTGNPAFWRVSFVITAVAGAAVLYSTRGLPGSTRVRNISDVTALALYGAIAVLALIGGADVERTEAVLLTVLLFVGFNIAWLFLFASLASAKPTSTPESPKVPTIASDD